MSVAFYAFKGVIIVPWPCTIITRSLITKSNLKVVPSPSKFINIDHSSVTNNVTSKSIFLASCIYPESKAGDFSAGDIYRNITLLVGSGKFTTRFQFQLEQLFVYHYRYFSIILGLTVYSCFSIVRSFFCNVYVITRHFLAI